MKGRKLITDIVQLSLCSLGIVKNKNFAIAYSIIVTAAMSLNILGSTVGFITATGTANKLEAMSSLLPQLATLLIYLNIYLSRHRLLDLLIQIKGNKGQADRIIEQVNVLVTKKLIWFLIVLVILAFCIILPPLFTSFHDSAIVIKNALAVPFWASCGNRRKKYIQYLCWNIDTKIELFGANFIICVITGFMLVVNGSAFSLYSVTMGELRVHMKCLKIETNHFIRMAATNQTIPGCNTERDQKMYDDLLELFRYQQYIRCCTLKMIETWKGYITIYSVDYFVAITMLMFMVFMEHNDAKILAIRATILCMYGFMIASMISYFAQVIQDINENIFDDILEIRWYNEHIKFRKTYAILLTLNRKSIHVKIANMYKLNLNSFGRLLKTAYSLLNVLLLKYGK